MYTRGSRRRLFTRFLMFSFGLLCVLSNGGIAAASIALQEGQPPSTRSFAPTSVSDDYLIDWAVYESIFQSGSNPAVTNANFPFFTIPDIAGSGVTLTMRVDPRLPRQLNADTFDWQEPYFGTKNVLRYWPTTDPEQGPHTINLAFSEAVEIGRLSTFARYDGVNLSMAGVIELYDSVLPDGTCTGTKLDPLTFTTPVVGTEDYTTRSGETFPVSMPNTILINDSTDAGEAAAAYGDYTESLDTTHPIFAYDTIDFHGAFATGSGSSGNARSVVMVEYGGTVARCIQWHAFRYAGTTPGGGDIPDSITSTYFGPILFDTISPQGSIGNSVWIDENSDGYQDAGEAGIPNVTVNLYNSAGSLVGTTITDSHGGYLFDALPTGDYYVDVDESTLPAGMTQTTVYPQPNGDFTNQDHSTTAIPNTAVTGYAVTITSTALENLSADFGYNYAPTSDVAGQCFDTLTNNGFEQFDPSVTFTSTSFSDFNGDTLQAYAWAQDDTNVYNWMPTLTGDGTYNSAFLIDDTAGNINNPEGDYFTYLPGGTDEAFECVEQSVDVFLSAGLIPGKLYTMCFMAAAGTEFINTVTHIEYAKGTSYAGLYSQNLPVSTSSTNLNWQQVCHTFTFDPAFMDRIVISQQGMGGISIDGMQLCENNSTTGGQNNGAIGDRIWIDADGDGAQDPNEIGVSGVEVTLYHDPDGDGIYDTVYGTTTTDDNGNYIFDNLPPAAYVVTVTDDTGASHPILDANHNQTGDPDHFGTTGTNNDNTTTTPVVLAPGDIFLNADFGYQPQGNAFVGSIGDTIFFDADGDGNGPSLAPVDGGSPVTQGAGGSADNTDYGIAGVTVVLIRDINGNGSWDAGEPIIATDTTDENGQYLFEDLNYDDYLVWVNDTANVLDGLTGTYDADGTNPTTGLVTGLGISAAEVSFTTDTIRDQDFGFGSGGSGLIGDTIFLNINGDNDQDANEPGIEDVTVTLTGSSSATTVTDENGRYYFGGLDPNGSYTVTVDPANFNSGGALEGLNNTADPENNNDNTSGVNLGAAGSDGNADPDGTDNGINLGQDFGYTPSNPATIGNLVWLDVDADGEYDGGVETPIGGVTVDLYRDLNNNDQIDAGEPKFGTTTTDATINAGSYGTNGNYLFTGLPAGNYVVDVTDVNGVLAGYWHSIGTAGTDGQSQVDPYGVSVVAGGSNLSADFGYYQALACLGNFFWDDSANSNGIQDASEPGINGVTLTLTITYPSGDVTVLKTVTGDDPSTGAVEQGWYSFCNLLSDENHRKGSGTAQPASGEPGFEISAELPSGMIPTIIDATAATDQTDSDDPTSTGAAPVQGSEDVVQNSDPASEGDPAASYDFGASNPVLIGDRVWIESDSDGRAATGTISAAPDVIASLTDANGTVITTTTNAGGFYTFTVPVNATYTVTVQTPNGGYAPSAVIVSGTDSDPNSNDDENHNSSSAVVAVGTANNLTIDFAFTANETFAIGNLVWIDGESTGNGQYNPNDGDVRAENVTMELYRVNNGTPENSPFLTTQTGTGVLQAGAYQFSGLDAGTYMVCVASQEFSPAGDLWYGDDGVPYGVVAANSGGTGGSDDNIDHNTVYVGNVIIQDVCSNHITLNSSTAAPTAENSHGLTTALSDTSVDWSVDFAFAPPNATAVNLSGTSVSGAPIVPLLISVVISIALASYFAVRDRKMNG